MSDATDFLENEVLDHILATGAYTAPVSVWVKLHIGAPGEAATANAAAEATRKQATFNVAAGGSAALASTISWTNVAATETVTHYSIWDASTAGNALVVGTLAASVALTAGDDLDITALTVSLA